MSVLIKLLVSKCQLGGDFWNLRVIKDFVIDVRNGKGSKVGDLSISVNSDKTCEGSADSE